MTSRIKFLLAVLFILACSELAMSQSLNIKKMENINTKAIARAYASSLRMWSYDTLRKQQNGSQFSGVVVSAEGHILTAAHAVAPGGVYKVLFSDGQEKLGVAFGRMGFRDQENFPDVAMVKIIDKGTWTFAEMGWSSSLKVNEPCLSISYPETLNQHKPSIRFGRIVEPLTEWGFVQSSCKMEPGDSGGPLFDYMGRVVGIHSRIEKPEQSNFEVPIDRYRKYWTALNRKEEFHEFPSQEDIFSADPMESKIMTVPALATIDHQFLKYEPKFKGISVSIISEKNGNSYQAVGTVLLLDGFYEKKLFENSTFLISKSSLVKNNPMVTSDIGKQLKASIVARDEQNDLVLLQVAQKSKVGVSLKMLQDTASVKFEEQGRFLLSVLPGSISRVSIIGSQVFSLPRKFSNGYFGANANFINNKITLTRITPGSPAAKHLELQDHITGINGVPISQPPHYGAELRKYSPGDSISIQGLRNGVVFNISVLLDAVPIKSNHFADQIMGGKSIRCDGFEKVFSHDAAIGSADCGGPVFDTNGRFYGINIARFSRTSTLISPVTVIFDFLKKHLKDLKG